MCVCVHCYVRCEEDVFRLEVAVYDGEVVQDDEGFQELLDELAHELRGQAAEVVLFDDFVQVEAEELKGDARVLLVRKDVLHLHNAVVHSATASGIHGTGAPS